MLLLTKCDKPAIVITNTMFRWKDRRRVSGGGYLGLHFIDHIYM